MAGNGRAWSVTVDGEPDEVRARIEAGLLAMSSLWFPSLAEMRRWDAATESMFLRWRADRFEVGPRLANLQAARFCPVLVGSLVAQGDGRTEVVGRVQAPAFATGLLTVWGALLALWLFAGLSGSQAEHGVGWLVGWAVMAGSAALAGGLGWWLGGSALRAALPELAQIAADPTSGADDW